MIQNLIGVKPEVARTRTLAELVPEAKLIMTPMRGPKYLEVAEKIDNIYLGTTGMFNLSKLREALRRLGAARA